MWLRVVIDSCKNNRKEGAIVHTICSDVPAFACSAKLALYMTWFETHARLSIEWHWLASQRRNTNHVFALLAVLNS